MTGIDYLLTKKYQNNWVIEEFIWMLYFSVNFKII